MRPSLSRLIVVILLLIETSLFAQKIKNGVSENGRVVFSNVSISIDNILAAACKSSNDSIVWVEFCKLKGKSEGNDDLRKLLRAKIQTDAGGRIVVFKNIYILGCRLEVNDTINQERFLSISGFAFQRHVQIKLKSDEGISYPF